MQKIAVCAICYNESQYISAFIRQWQGFVDKVVVLVSSLPWNGTPSEYDGTADIAKRAGAEVIIGFWENEAAQRNWGLAYLYNYDYVITCDPDEFFLREDKEKIIKALSEKNEMAVWEANKMRTFWKTPGYIFDPPDKHKPVIAINPKKGRFKENRSAQPFAGNNPYLEPVGRLDVTCYHFSWVKSDDKIKEKIDHFSHSDIVRPNWFDEVWMKWRPGDGTMVRPYGHERSIIKQESAPKEIIDLFN